MLRVQTMMLLATYLKLQFGRGLARLGRVTLAFHAAAFTRRTHRQARLSSLAGSDALCLQIATTLRLACRRLRAPPGPRVHFKTASRIGIPAVDVTPPTVYPDEL